MPPAPLKLVHPITVTREARQVEVMPWGPTWGQMKLTAEWLGSRGVMFWFPSEAEYPLDHDFALPELRMYSPRFDTVPVRIGDYIVVKGQGDAYAISKAEFKQEYS